MRDRDRIDALERRLDYLQDDVLSMARGVRQSDSALFEAIVRCLKKNPSIANGQRVVFITQEGVDVGRLDEIEDGGGGPLFCVLTDAGMKRTRDVYVIDPS